MYENNILMRVVWYPQTEADSLREAQRTVHDWVLFWFFFVFDACMYVFFLHLSHGIGEDDFSVLNALLAGMFDHMVTCARFAELIATESGVIKLRPDIHSLYTYIRRLFAFSTVPSAARDLTTFRITRPDLGDVRRD